MGSSSTSPNGGIGAFGKVIGDYLARSSTSGGAAASNASGDPIKALYDLNDGWRGMYAAPTFAEDRAMRDVARNSMGLSSAAQLVGDRGWAPTSGYGYQGSADGITGWQPGPSVGMAGTEASRGAWIEDADA